MAKVIVKEDCGNAPKKELLRDFEIAFAENNHTFILENISDDIVWTVVGANVIRGKKEVEKTCTEMLDGSITELTLDMIITHGDTGAVNGTMKFTNGKTYGYCDVFKFESHAKDAKIQELTSYVIEI